MKKVEKLLVVGSVLLLGACASTGDTLRTMGKTAQDFLKEGDEQSARGNYEDAIAQWKRVRDSYRMPELVTIAELKIADAHFANRSYIEAAAAYEDFRKLHPNHEQVPYALYRVGLSYFNQIDGVDVDQTAVKNAATTFENFLKLYPDSQYATEARQKLQDCQTKMAQYEVYVGRFYFRTGKYAAATKRLEEALKKYPKTGANDEILYYLGASYLRGGDRQKGRDAFIRLSKEYTQSPFLNEAQKLLEKEY